MVRSVLRLPPGAPVRDQDKARVLWASARAARMLGGMSRAELESLGRAVLHLPDTVRWDRPRGQALAVLVAAANAEGLDTADRDVLGAFHLKWNGAFSPSVLLSRDGDTQGVNWSGRPAPGGVNARRVRVIGADGDVQTVVAPWAAPGKSLEYHIVWTDTDPAGGLVLHLPGLGAVPVRSREFLALLELSPLLRTLRLGIPVVFLVSGLGAPGHRGTDCRRRTRTAPAGPAGATADPSIRRRTTRPIRWTSSPSPNRTPRRQGPGVTPIGGRTASPVTTWTSRSAREQHST